MCARAGGHITLRSRLGFGTTFELYFAAAEPAPADAQASFETSDGHLVSGSANILLVEDETALRDARHGYTVIMAESGEAALRVAAESGHAPDLVLTDVVMPGMSGVDLVRALRLEHPAIRVVMMSGYAEALINRQGSDMATATFIEKPLTLAALLDTVRHTLRPRRDSDGHGQVVDG